MLQQVGNPSTKRNGDTQGVGVDGPAYCQRIVSSFSAEVGVD
jgi:hypothetical protein